MTETEEESQTMTDSTSNQVKWIPIDAENLPEGVVLAISKEGMMYLSSLRLVSDVPIINEDKSPTFVVGAGYIPLEELRQLWDEQNPAARYSKESQAYEIILWHQKDGEQVLKEPLHSALKECPLDCTKLIRFIAEGMVKETYQEKRAEQMIADTVVMDELVYWLKEYIAGQE
jgi:hypothetical protein